MSSPEYPRELAIDQGHAGVSLLAGLLALVATCLAVILALALVMQMAQWNRLMLCLFLPVFGLLMFLGSLVAHLGERRLQRFWPSGRRLVLDREGLMLKRRDRIEDQILWVHPFTALRWRIRRIDRTQDPTLSSASARLCLACQLCQKDTVISLYTGSSPRDWRRVPGWKLFPLLERPRRAGQWPLPRRPAVPSHRGPSSLPQADPDRLWPAERHRQRRGLALSFDDFRAVIAAVEQHAESQDAYD